MDSAKIHFSIQPEYANSVEAYAIISASLLTDQYTKQVMNYIPDHIPANHVPVGSVEWCREFGVVQGKVLYEHMDYPEHFKELFKRNIRLGLVEELKPGDWTKPTYTKQFPAQIVNDHSPVMYETGEPVELNATCWISDIVRFGPEFRCYVLDRKIAGISQYDDGAPCMLSAANVKKIMDLVGSWDSPTVTYALDVGLLEDTNELALVEANAAWGTGYYPGETHGLSYNDYAKWLSTGWRQLARVQLD